MIDVCLPGTGGMVPRHDRYLSCCFMLYNGSAVLIDCGEGTQIALQKSRCRISRLKLLLITHYHADHIAGLPGLLLSIGNSGKRTPLTIAGPDGLAEVVTALMTIAPVLPYPLRLAVFRGPSDELSMDDMRVDALALDHGVPCLGYRISVARKPVFNPNKAQALAVPKKLYRTLHAGNRITLHDGRTITPEMVTDGPRLPLRICYATDTRMVLISEGMYGDDAMRGKADEHRHMLFTDSARLARSANVKRLWLTHYSPAVNDPKEYLPLVSGIFPQTEAAYDGIRATL